MRKIAELLNCGTMSLYNHVSGKEELLEGMMDSILRDIEYPAKSEHWKMQVKKLLVNIRMILLNHLWAPEVWQKTMPRKNRIQFMNSILQILADGKLSDEAVYRGYCAITMHLIGFTQQEISFKGVLGENLEEIAGGFMASLPAECTHLAEHIQKRIDRTLDDNDFEFVLNILLDGLEGTAELRK